MRGRGSPSSASRTLVPSDGVHLVRHVLDEDADSAHRRGRSEVQERLRVLWQRGMGGLLQQVPPGAPAETAGSG